MKIILLTIVTTVLIDNVVLSQFLGLCPFLGVSGKIKTAFGMSGAVVFVMALSSFVSAVIYELLLKPFDLGYLRTIVFILIIAALVQFVEMVLKKFIPALHQSLGVYLPLITTNCAVLGAALKNVQDGLNIGMSTLAGTGTAIGFGVAIIIMAGIREKIEGNDVPRAFRGLPLALMTAGLMAIAFMGFSSLR
ncbi:MAG: RnfABCDGE type electron transport complex subunit A [Clostridia bacterium]|nr:RnfABCDGE type electron transport complex subunit A [Clostridia bacterium]